MTSARKPHIRVDQTDLLIFVVAHAPLGVSARRVAEAHDISPATARRKLDGLVHQGALVSEGRPACYYAAAQR